MKKLSQIYQNPFSKNVILYDFGDLGAQGLRKDENPGLKGFHFALILGAIF